MQSFQKAPRLGSEAVTRQGLLQLGEGRDEGYLYLYLLHYCGTQEQTTHGDKDKLPPSQQRRARNAAARHPRARLAISSLSPICFFLPFQ